MAAPNNSSIDGKQHSLLQGDRLSKELEAQRARALARAYVATQGQKEGGWMDAWIKKNGWMDAASRASPLSASHLS